ncbi:MAG TPA: hypothetical protein VMG10_00920 [Gemmataceae bacterium]|nr:hypothetical protein [Gemmataceae bacterium]
MMSLSPRRFPGRSIGLLGVLVSLAAAGCGASKGKISGKVYYQNTLVKGGTVSFVSADKTSHMAQIKEDGSYTVEKVPVGEATICVETQSFKPPSINAPHYQLPPGVQGPGGYKPPDRAARGKRYVAIPDRYASPEQSGLKYTVKPGSQEHDIKME